MKKLFKLISITLLVIMLLLGGFIVKERIKNLGLSYAVKSYAKQSTTVTTTKSDDGNEYYFTQQSHDLDKQLIKVINSSKKYLDVAIYTITKQNIADAIISAKKRGVIVEVITDKDQATNEYQAKILKQFKSAGIPIKVNTHDGIMHLKVTIVDNSIVTSGSYNYSETATTLSDEVLIVINNPSVAKTFYSEFSKMWKDTNNYKEVK